MLEALVSSICNNTVGLKIPNCEKKNETEENINGKPAQKSVVPLTPLFDIARHAP